MKDEHTYFEKMARIGRNTVIYKGTFVSNQSLEVEIFKCDFTKDLDPLCVACSPFKMHTRYVPFFDIS